MTDTFFGRISKHYHSLWRDLKGTRLFLFYLLHFTFLFIIVQLFVFKDFYISGKSFIHQLDGFTSHYSSMVISSKAFSNLISGKNTFDFTTIPVRPGINFSVFSFLASLFPMEMQEYVYDFLVLLKIYLAGSSFSIMGFYFRQKAMPIMIGAFSYAFCGFSLLFCLQQPSFYEALIIMPLFVIGTEEILKGKKAFLFIALVFISLAANVYLAYDYALLILIYYLLRYFFSYNDRTFKSFFRSFGKLVVSGITGILLSGAFLLPYAYMITHMEAARIGRSVPNLLFYPFEYYSSFLSDFSMIVSDNLHEGSLGFSIIAVPCVITLLTEKKKNLFLKPVFILLSAMLLIPFFGYVFSGFNNVVNRWCFAYALCVSSVITFAVPSFIEASLKKKTAIISATLVWVAIALFLSGKYENLILMLILVIFSLTELLTCFFLKTNTHILKQSSLAVLIIFTCITPVAGLGFRQGDLPLFLDKDKAFSYLGEGQYASLSQSGTVINDKEKYFRVNGSSIFWYTMLSAPGYGLNGTSFYSSFYYPEYMDFLKQLEMTQRGAMNYNLGLDARAVPLSLAGVRYHAARVSDSPVYPYGFTEKDRIQNGKNTDVILQNDHFLPIGFTYDKYISKSSFESLSSLDKQNAMINSVYLETTPSNLAEDTEHIHKAKKLDYKATGADGVELTDHMIKVNHEKAHITLEFEGIPGEETYVRFVNLKLTEKCTSKELYLYTKADGKINHTRFLKEDYVYYGGFDDQMICLGSSKDGIRSCTLYFNNVGEYSIDELQVLSQDMSEYGSAIEKLRSESLSDVMITAHGFTGDITTSSDRFLCFTIPYDSGWKCYVDGKETQINKANIGFMGVELSEGHHRIDMVYSIPLLKEGSVMSITGIILLLIITVYDMRKTKKAKAAQSDK